MCILLLEYYVEKERAREKLTAKRDPVWATGSLATTIPVTGTAPATAGDSTAAFKSTSSLSTGWGNTNYVRFVQMLVYLLEFGALCIHHSKDCTYTIVMTNVLQTGM